MIRFHTDTTLKTNFSLLFLTLLFLFTIPACTNSDAELAQKIQALSKEEKIAALRAEINTALNKNFKVGDEENKYKNRCIGSVGSRSRADGSYGNEAIDDMLKHLITSPYAADLSSDELLTIFKTETALPVDHIIRPQTDLDHIIVGLRTCRISSHHTPLHQFHLLDRTGQMQQFARGTLLDDWAFPDGEALFLNTGNLASGTTPLALYRTYNDGTELRVSELVFDPEAHSAYKSNVAFDENEKRFTVYIPSYGTWQPPCEYTAEFMEEYRLVSDWNVTLSYTFDDGLFTLEEREYGDWTAIDYGRKTLTSETEKMDILTSSEWQQFCVSGTLRPVLP